MRIMMMIYPAALLIFMAHALPAVAQGNIVLDLPPEPAGAVQDIEITSDRLEVDQAAGEAIFLGNVRVSRGSLQMMTSRLRAKYDAEGQKIIQVQALEGVTLITPEQQAEAAEAVYLVQEGTVVLTGDVLLTQQDTILSGDRLVIDLALGTGDLSGNVKSVFREKE